jgi:ribonuclease R
MSKQATSYAYSFEDLEGMSEEISTKERRASKAERDTVERYAARYLEEHIGTVMSVRINGITDFAVFVTHLETGADGILPLSRLGGDYFDYEPRAQRLVGRKTRQTLTLGEEIEATLDSVDIHTGSLMFSLGPVNRATLKGRFGAPGGRRRKKQGA